MEDTDQQLWVGTENDGSYVFNWEKQSLTHFNYRLMSKEIDYLTFQREKEVLRQYIRHEAIYNDQYTLSENLADNYTAYKKHRFTLQISRRKSRKPHYTKIKQE